MHRALLRILERKAQVTMRYAFNSQRRLAVPRGPTRSTRQARENAAILNAIAMLQRRATNAVERECFTSIWNAARAAFKGAAQ